MGSWLGSEWGPDGGPEEEKNAEKIPKKIGRAGHGGIRTQSENPKFIYHRHHIDTHAHTERVTALECVSNFLMKFRCPGAQVCNWIEHELDIIDVIKH